MPVIGQGTWHLEQDDRARGIAALRLGLDLGMTHVDTAELYGSGAVESLVGLTVEAIILTPIALGYLIYLDVNGSGLFLQQSRVTDALLILAMMFTTAIEVVGKIGARKAPPTQASSPLPAATSREVAP